MGGTCRCCHRADRELSAYAPPYLASLRWARHLSTILENRIGVERALSPRAQVPPRYLDTCQQRHLLQRSIRAPRATCDSPSSFVGVPWRAVQWRGRHRRAGRVSGGVEGWRRRGMGLAMWWWRKETPFFAICSPLFRRNEQHPPF